MSKKNKKESSKLKLYYKSHKDLPAFKALIKLMLYFIFFAIIIGVVATHQDVTKDENKNNQEQTKETIKRIPYKEVLDLLNNSDSSVSYNITINGNLHKIELEYIDKVYTGIIESTSGITRFKIQDNNIYEVKMDEEVINNDLFKDINLDYILISNLTNILLNNKSIKMLEDNNTIYKYNIDNIEYIITIKDNWVNKIEINNDTLKYMIEYKKK